MIRMISRLKLTLVETGSSAFMRGDATATSSGAASRAQIDLRAERRYLAALGFAVPLIPLVALVQVGPPGMRIRGVPVKRIARQPLVENAAVVHEDLGGGAVRVRASVVERPELGRGVCVELEFHARTHRPNEH